MATVYLVMHYHRLPQDESNAKLIGVFSSKQLAEAAVERIRRQPGFRDLPEVHDEPSYDGGFAIDPVELDRVEWQEGYVTV